MQPKYFWSRILKIAVLNVSKNIFGGMLLSKETFHLGKNYWCREHHVDRL